MPKKTEERAWTVYRLKGTPAAYVGRVVARDADAAIRKAIDEYQITDLQQQKRLMARPS
jgi:hypothetical protein